MDFSDFKNTMLVPIDFTDDALIALDHAGGIAHALEDDNHKVTLLYVAESGDLDYPYLEGNPLPENLNKSFLVEGIINRLEQLKNERMKNINASVSYAITSGKVYREVSEMANKMKADTIVMGTKGSPSNSAFLGSNASRVVQTAPCPVVVVRERGYEKGYQNIVLPLDLTKETKQKVDWAIKVAQYYNAKVHIFSVSQDDEYLRNRIKNNINQVEGILNNNNIETTATTVTETNGNFAQATLDFAEEKGADLIMIMSQQERSLTEYIFGSYAQQIVGRSHIPVMCINPKTNIHGFYESGSPHTAFPSG
jgi:nucleotide-binding universal stress UspA family protein